MLKIIISVYLQYVTPHVIMETVRGKRQVLHKQAREMVYKVYSYFLREAEELADLPHVAKVQERTASACDVGIRTVQRIVNESNKSLNTCGSVVLKSPGKNHNRNKPISDLDNFNKDILRGSIFEMYTRGEFPTAEKLVKIMNEKVGFVGSASSMLRILRGLGFRYKMCNNGRKFLMERSDIAAARARFLRKIHEVREAGHNIFYLDETWVNQNYTRQSCWVTSDGSGGLKVPTGKGGRLIICHAGSAATGFIPQSKLVFKCKKQNSNTDYHSEMNAETFEKWFIQDFLPYLPPASYIVMDNASYHSRLRDKPPTTSSRKAEITAWLSEKNIPFQAKETRNELLEKVRANRSDKIYVLDSIALEKVHNVIRLPAYHCQYNPIELVWAQVKGFVAERNTTFKIADTEILVNEAIDNIAVSAWENCVRHAEKIQEDDFNRELLVDTALEPIIINLQDDTSQSEDESMDENE